MKSSVRKERFVVSLVKAALLAAALLAGIATEAFAQQGSDGFVYVLRNDTAGNGGSKIYGYRVDPVTGLTAIAGFPIATGGEGSAPGGMSEGVVIDRANRRLFAINLTSRTVSGFAIGPTSGALTTLPFSPFSLGAAPSGGETLQCLAVHPSGSPLVVASRSDLTTLDGRVYSFNVTATSATGASGSPYLTGADTNPLSCEFSRAGDYFYTGGYDGLHFAGFAVGAGTGILTALAGSPFLSGGSATGAFATDDTGRLFGADFGTTVRAYTTSAGVPSQASFAPSGLAITWDGLLHPAGFYIVAASGGSTNVGVFQIGGSGAGTTLTAVAGSPFATGGTDPLSLALDRTGTLLFATNSTSRNLTTFSMNTSTGALAILGTQPVNSLGTTGDIGGVAFARFAGAADLAIDFGAAGLWVFYNNTAYQQLHAVSPEEMVTGDLDNNDIDEVILDFGADGIWIRQNNTSWSQLHTANPSRMATGDLDGRGQDEVLIVFPGFGLWVWANNSGFYRLAAQDPNRMVIGDLDGNGQDEAILNFAGQGIWVWENDTSWRQLHATDAAAFAVGDLDGGGRADLIVDFPGFGLWVWSNNTSWFQLHTADATVMTTGDIDGSGQADAIISFPGSGIWAWMNSTDFKQLHVSNGAILRTADIDLSGRADVIISFPGFGIWAWMNDTNWNQLHVQNPEGITEGNLDGN